LKQSRIRELPMCLVRLGVKKQPWPVKPADALVPPRPRLLPVERVEPPPPSGFPPPAEVRRRSNRTPSPQGRVLPG
jgi:hypothetical protein